MSDVSHANFSLQIQKTALGERGFTSSRLMSLYIGFSRSQGFIRNPNGLDNLMGASSADRQIHSPF
jgi:hypothetical protein